MTDDAIVVSAAVHGDALRIRRQGTLLGAMAAALFFGGLLGEQPWILFSGAVLLVATVALRALQKRRALASMSPAHALAVQAEVKRGASQPLITSSLGRWVAWAVAAVVLWLLVLR